MLEQLNDFLLAVADPLFNCLLILPRDLVLLVVAMGTAAILAVVRIFTTNRDLLARCKRDKKRLRQRIREVKERDHSDLVEQKVSLLAAELSREGHKLDGVDTDKVHSILHRALRRLDLAQLTATRSRVSIRMLKQEALPLLVSLPLVVLIATWAFARIGYVPPDGDEPVEVRMYLPKSGGGSLVHLEPRPGLEATDGWMREVEVVTQGGQTYGLAVWPIRGEISEDPYALRVKHGNRTYAHKLLIGQRVYTPPLKMFQDAPGAVLEVGMDAYRPFGFVPGIPWINFAPWIVGYLLIVIPLVPLIRRALRIH